MDPLALPDIHDEEFQAKVELNGKELRLSLVGNADMRAREALQNLLSLIDGEARRAKVSVVFVDFRELEFMNSSCFKGFVSWINQAKAVGEGERYKIRFASNEKRAWHRRSLHALQCFATDLVTIEVL